MSGLDFILETIPEDGFLRRTQAVLIGIGLLALILAFTVVAVPLLAVASLFDRRGE